MVYNGNGATGGSTATSTHTYGVGKALTTNGYTKTDHIFAGWATSATGAVAYTDGQSVTNLTTGTGTVTLYAVWTPNVYTITTIANEGTVIEGVYDANHKRCSCGGTNHECEVVNIMIDANGSTVTEQ